MNIHELSDAELISLYKFGNEEAFGVLVDRHKSKVFTTIYLIVKDNNLAEDILQDVFIKVVNTIKSGRYNEEGKFKPWLMRIAHNLAVDHFRKSKRYPTVQMDEGNNVSNSLEFKEESIEADNIRNELHNQLRTHIKDLPEPQREVLLMRHYGEMSFQEIAEATGVSINTALGRMRYALINLRKQFKNNDEIAYDRNLYP